jgi:predicted amidohydrolase
MAPRSKLSVAVVQMSSQADVEANLQKACSLIEQAAARGAELVVLPENFAYMGSEEGRRVVAYSVEVGPAEPSPAELGSDETGTSPGGKRRSILHVLGEAAERWNVYVVAGGMPERSRDSERPYNTSVVVGPDGTIVASYRKIHMFDVDVGDGHPYAESASTTPGDESVCADVLGFRIGLSICYDVRFPELYRSLVDKGAELLVVSAAFTLLTGKDHWHVLLRARAIEAQCYVLASAQWGTHPKGRRTYGKSVIVDPWGDIVAQCSEGEGIALGCVDRAYLDQIRASLPALRHRRLP